MASKGEMFLVQRSDDDANVMESVRCRSIRQAMRVINTWRTDETENRADMGLLLFYRGKLAMSWSGPHWHSVYINSDVEGFHPTASELREGLD